jgi:hypothetical protein
MPSLTPRQAEAHFAEVFMRYLFLAIFAGSALSACGTNEPVAVEPSTNLPIVVQGVPAAHIAAFTKELPKDWPMKDIVDAAPPRGDTGATHILAWKIIEDARPNRVESCLALKELRQPTEKGERWVLSSLVRNPAMGREWNFAIIWATPDTQVKGPPFIIQVQHYQDRPTNSEIHHFMDKFDWRLGGYSDCKLVDGGICAAWEKVVGEKPVRTFTP